MLAGKLTVTVLWLYDQAAMTFHWDNCDPLKDLYPTQLCYEGQKASHLTPTGPVFQSLTRSTLTPRRWLSGWWHSWTCSPTSWSMRRRTRRPPPTPPLPPPRPSEGRGSTRASRSGEKERVLRKGCASDTASRGVAIRTERRVLDEERG